MNADIMNTQIFCFFKYDLNGHWRSQKVTFMFILTLTYVLYEQLFFLVFLWFQLKCWIEDSFWFPVLMMNVCLCLCLNISPFFITPHHKTKHINSTLCLEQADFKKNFPFENSFWLPVMYKEYGIFYCQK